MLATVASINSAGRLKEHLFRKYNVSAAIIQTPSSLTKEGCGYSLRFDDSHKDFVILSGKQLNINIRSFFREEKTEKGKKYVKD